MNNQLNSISTQYRKFSKGQYVEHTQFNEFLDYFEDQDRLSRVMLEGVGIVCGLKPELVYIKNRLSSIQLSQGIAITTDGDLFTLTNKSTTKNTNNDSYVSALKMLASGNKQYTHFKVYDNHKVKYPAFYDNNENQIPLWELATSTEATSGFQPLANLDYWEGKYLLLYLENYEKEVRPCRGVDCDNHGVQQIQNLKVLVTSTEGINQIRAKDIVSPHSIYLGLNGYEKLKRVILAPVQQTPSSLKQAYQNVLAQSNYSTMFSNIDAISLIMGIPVINKTNFITAINTLANQNKNFQYTYNVLKDLTDTYTEIIRLLPKSFTKFFPDIKSFPKHIMLGKLVPNTTFDKTRHEFYNSPVLDNDKTTQRVRNLIGRFNSQTIEFKDPSELAAKNGIRITPSKLKGVLATQAIPFYYRLTKKILDFWNFDKTKNRDSDANLSYDRDILSNDLHIQNPLGYNVDRKTFYLIEGQQGMNYKTAVNTIRQIKDDQQLGFDVMALSLEQLNDNKDISRAYFTEYVEKNPGLEHLGGVERGGTFAVVYESEKNPTVIADFALPYICCTPKFDVALSLPSDSICIDAAPVAFTVTPLNGVVKADVAAGYVGGVQNVNGQYQFNPRLVESDLLDQEIGFTVNDKLTGFKVKVMSFTDVTIRASSFAYPEAGSSNTIVTFNVLNLNDGDFEYKWDFLGNGTYIAVQPDAQGNVKYTYVNLDPSKPVNILVTGNGCSQNIRLTNWYVPKPAENTPPAVDITGDTGGLYWPDAQAKLYSTITQGSGTVNNYLWTCTNSSVIFATPNASSTGITFPSAGTYTIKFTIKDTNNFEASDSITMIVGTKASLKGIILNDSTPTTDDEVEAVADLINPSNIGGLKYEWYLDGDYAGQTDSAMMSFGTLNAGERKIDVRLIDSDGGNHLDNLVTVVFRVSEQSGLGTSFLAGTQITLADGRKVPIESLKGGEELKSQNGIVTVVRIANYTIEADVYRLNEQNYFITGTHPVLTDRGWMSFEPERTNTMISSIQVGLLADKDMLIRENGEKVALSNVDRITGRNLFYNIEVDRTKVFFANGYVVYSEMETVPEG